MSLRWLAETAAEFASRGEYWLPWTNAQMDSELFKNGREAVKGMTEPYIAETQYGTIGIYSTKTFDHIDYVLWDAENNIVPLTGFFYYGEYIGEAREGQGKWFSSRSFNRPERNWVRYGKHYYFAEGTWNNDKPNGAFHIEENQFDSNNLTFTEEVQVSDGKYDGISTVRNESSGIIYQNNEQLQFVDGILQKNQELEAEPDFLFSYQYGVMGYGRPCGAIGTSSPINSD